MTWGKPLFAACVGAFVVVGMNGVASAQQTPYDDPPPGGIEDTGAVFVTAPGGGYVPGPGGRGGPSGGGTVPPFNGPYCRSQVDSNGVATYGFGEALANIGDGYVRINPIPPPPDAADNPNSPGTPAVLVRRECGNFVNGVFLNGATTYSWTFGAPPPPPPPPPRFMAAGVVRARIRWVPIGASNSPAADRQVVFLPIYLQLTSGNGTLSASASFPGGYSATATATPVALLFDPGDDTGRYNCGSLTCIHEFRRSSANQLDQSFDGLVQLQYRIVYTFSWGAAPVIENYVSPFAVAPDFVVSEVQAVNQ
jgi:hypothetical protein